MRSFAPPRRFVPAGLLALVTAAVPVLAAEKTEEYASGKVKAKYAVTEGVKDGPFTEYYESGKVRAKGTYKAGVLDGTHTAYYPTGPAMAVATYDAGKLNGKYAEDTPKGARRLTATYKGGELTSLQFLANGKPVAEQSFQPGDWVPPRRLAEIQLEQAAVAPAAPAKSTDPIDRQREAALRRLMAYRALCRVPYADLALDKDMNDQAAAGAELCQALGRLEHRPQNTLGWDADKFDLAFKGTSRGNLYGGSAPHALATSVDAYMDDSDPKNIDRVGHRMWCLNPTMQKVGFGLSPKGTFSAMWAHDRSRKPVPDYDFVAYPPPGFVPSGLFGARYAWSFTPNPKKYTVTDLPLMKAKLYLKTDKSADKPGAEVKLDYNEPGNFLTPNAIFRPQAVNLAEGTRYVVEVTGFKTLEGKDVTFTYMVIFVNSY